MTKHLYIFILCIFALTTEAASFADNAVERHRPYSKVPLSSSVLKETVDIYVQLPFKYESQFMQKERYPVIYVLDAPVGLPLISGILEPLIGYNNAPQMIVVGVSTSNRNRDLTPSIDLNYESHGGGADKYLEFIEKEVIPYINENYRTEDFRVLSGHSYGGLFATYAFYKKPNLFQAHFANSPSLFWENGKTVKELIKFVEQNPNHKNFLYMNMGNEGNPESGSPEGVEMLKGVQMIESALTSLNAPNLSFKFEYFSNEPHQTTPIYGAIGALRGLYPQWSIPYKTSMAGYESVMEHFEQLSNKYGYKIEAKGWQIYDEGVAQLTFLNNPSEAIKYFNHNVSRDPLSDGSRKKIVDAYVQLGKVEKALEHLRVLISRDDLEDKERQTLLEKISTLKNK